MPLALCYCSAWSAFSDCVPFNNIEGWCENFVKLGFVAISVEYRRGTKGEIGFVTAQDGIALYRAVQDVRGGIRSIIYRQTKEGMPGIDDDYRIDLNRLFLAGESAGGLAIFGAAYYNQSMMNTLLPAVSPGMKIQDICGDIDAAWYNDGGNNNMNYYRSYIKGILIRSAGMYIPNSFASNPRSFFQVTPFIPTIFFHGQQDDVFDIDSIDLNYSTSSGFNSTTKCTDDAPDSSVFKVNANASTIDIREYGSRGIFMVFLQNSSYPLVPAELYIDCQMVHNLQETSTPYYTGFGSGATSRPQVVAYITSRAAIFFGNIIYGNAGNLNRKVFIECKNKRKGVNCTTGDNFEQNCCNNGCLDQAENTNKCNINQQLPQP